MKHRRLLAHMIIGMAVVVLLLSGWTATGMPTQALVASPPSPTQTPSPPPTPTPPATASAPGMNQRVQGSEWAITVASAKNEGTKIVETTLLLTSTRTLTFEVKSPDVHVLRVKVEIERLDGTPIHDDYLQEDNSLRQVVVRDAPGQTYAFSAAGIGAYYYDVPKGGEQTIMYCAEEECTIDYIFVVPNDVEITHFVWSDLPPVRLEIEQLAPSPTDTPTPAPTSTATPTSTPTPTLIATSTATPTIVLTPRAGTWTGRGTFFTEQGEERNLVVIFVVNEDGTQITMIATIYIQGPYIQGKEYDAFVAVTPQDIVDNSFSIGSHWQTSITGPWIDYAYEGTFISPTRLKGTLHGAMRIA